MHVQRWIQDSKVFPFLTENERQEVYDGLIAEAARLSMQPSEVRQ